VNPRIIELTVPPKTEVRLRHSLALRWFHWLNVPLLATMIWSGLLIYWAYDPYEIRVFGHPFLHFFPAPLYKALGIEGRLAEGLGWHFLFMWFFALNGLVYVLYLGFSGEWRHLLPIKGSLKEAIQVTLHDLYLSKAHPKIEGYNGAQRFAYTGIILAGAGSLITGLAIYKPARLQWLASLMGGYQFARLLHFALMIGFVLFFVVHIIQVARAGWNNFRGMVTGYEVAKVEEPA